LGVRWSWALSSLHGYRKLPAISVTRKGRQQHHGEQQTTTHVIVSYTLQCGCIPKQNNDSLMKRKKGQRMGVSERREGPL
jgi:hypothetical protein